jgi:tetratricopeptide (TPR) repeat protein
MLAFMALATASYGTFAQDEPERDYFEEGTEALRQGRYGDAIDRLEAYADRSQPHPDASFNRGLAYIMRIRNHDEKSGDLGRAAAAFEETLALDPDDDEARDALGRVHGEVARRRSRKGKDSLLSKPTLDRVVINLASERGWGIAAIVSSLLLAVAMVLRQRRSGTLHLAGTLMLPASAIALIALLPLYLGARDLRLHSRAAVVVVKEARVVDETGKALGGEAIPEAAKLEIGDRKGRYIHFRYGSREGWVPLSTVRVLRTR